MLQFDKQSISCGLINRSFEPIKRKTVSPQPILAPAIKPPDPPVEIRGKGKPDTIRYEEVGRFACRRIVQKLRHIYRRRRHKGTIYKGESYLL